MSKFYVVSEKNVLSKEDKVYKSKEEALLNKSVEIMESEYGIKPSSGFIKDVETSKIEYTLIERYNNQFYNLNKKVYLISIDSQSLEEAHLLEIKEIENLYKYLSSDNNFYLVSNDDLEMKVWLNVPIYNTDVIQKYFLDNLDKPKKVRIENINKLKELYPESIYGIEDLESFIFRMPLKKAKKFLIGEFREDNYVLAASIRSQQKKYSNLARRLVLKIKNK